MNYGSGLDAVVELELNKGDWRSLALVENVDIPPFMCWFMMALSGQNWYSCGLFADWGSLLARTQNVGKRVFRVAMDLPGH